MTRIKKQIQKKKKKAGFTLIEILLYISLVSIVVFGISNFFVLIQRVKVKNQIIATVNSEGTFVSDFLSRAIRESTGVVFPPPGGSSGVLRLTIPGSNSLFGLMHERFLVAKSGVITPLTDDRVTVSGSGTPIYQNQWGSQGSGQGQFQIPGGIATSSSGNVYVAETGNSRVQEFDSYGNFINQLGSYGGGSGQLINPHGVAVDSSDNVYVADTGNNRIEIFDSNGNYLSQCGYGGGSGDGQFIHPMGVALDSMGNIYVTDTGNNRIEKLSSSCGYITQWGYQGTGVGQFQYPVGIAADSLNNIYVTDSGNNRVEKFNSNGKYITEWNGYGNYAGYAGINKRQLGNGLAQILQSVIKPFLPQMALAQGYNGGGSFNFPTGVTVDSFNNVYVADTYGNRIAKYDSSGVFLTQWGTYGTGDGQFIFPSGIAVGSLGGYGSSAVYVADTYGNRIEVFTPTVFSSSYSYSGGNTNVSYSFTVKAQNTNNNPGYEYHYQKNFTGGATMRNH